MKKIAIMMTVHNNVKQLKRLCKTLENDNVFFFIHVDKKADINPFLENLKDIKNINIYSKEKVYWADISQVDATVFLLSKIINCNIDYILFISGQDYLIKETNLLNNIDITKNYLECEKLPNKAWGIDGRCNRYKFYHNIINNIFPFKFNPRNRYYMFINRSLIKIQKTFKVNKKFIEKYIPYSGSNWFNINMDAAKYIVNNYENVRNYFKYVQFPDEMVIQTMLKNSAFKNSVINDSLRYVDWVTGPEEPRTLTYEDYDKLLNAAEKVIFARKFDTKKDEKILDMLDKIRGEKNE